jgi:hypothetical protein
VVLLQAALESPEIGVVTQRETAHALRVTSALQPELAAEYIKVRHKPAEGHLASIALEYWFPFKTYFA